MNGWRRAQHRSGAAWLDRFDIMQEPTRAASGALCRLPRERLRGGYPNSRFGRRPDRRGGAGGGRSGHDPTRRCQPGVRAVGARTDGAGARPCHVAVRARHVHRGDGAVRLGEEHVAALRRQDGSTDRRVGVVGRCRRGAAARAAARFGPTPASSTLSDSSTRKHSGATCRARCTVEIDTTRALTCWVGLAGSGAVLRTPAARLIDA
jgi:hypothetical protein